MYNKKKCYLYNYICNCYKSSTLVFAGPKCLLRAVKKAAFSSLEVKIGGRNPRRALHTAFCRQ